MNTVAIIGRLTRDPEVRYGAESQTAVTRFSIAIDRGKDKDGKDKGADFPSIVCFGKTAELVEKYMSKGRMIGVQGHIQTGSYTNNDGQKVYTTEVVADRVFFLGSKEEGTASDEPTNGVKDDIPSGFTKLDSDDLPF